MFAATIHKEPHEKLVSKCLSIPFVIRKEDLCSVAPKNNSLMLAVSVDMLIQRNGRALDLYADTLSAAMRCLRCFSVCVVAKIKLDCFCQAGKQPRIVRSVLDQNKNAITSSVSVEKTVFEGFQKFFCVETLSRTFGDHTRICVEPSPPTRFSMTSPSS